GHARRGERRQDDDEEDRERRRRVHPDRRARARAERRLGREGGAPGRLDHRARGGAPQGRRSRRRLDAGPPAEDRRAHRQDRAGLLLILFGIVMLVAEIKIVSHGILAIGGIVSMALGSLMLFDAPEIGLRVSWWAIVPMVGATAGLFLFVIAAGVRALARRQLLGPSGLVGQLATVKERLAPEGQVLVSGEIWRAVAGGEPV